jgi:imidazolonepropionase-like amidohydrolase
VLRGATVISAAGPSLERGDVWIRGDRIAAVGPALDVPPDVPVLDVTGRFITPGLIDPHSHIGVYPVPAVAAHADGNESSGPLKPEVRAIEAFWPQDPAIRRAVAGGVTTIHVLPGSANLVGGQGATLSLVPARAAAEMRFPGAPTTMKMACGENPKRVYGERKQAPVTRMGEVAMLREALEGARAYRPDPEKPLEHAKRALHEVIEGEILIQNHCYRADEMLVRIALFDEFEVRPRAFHHAVEAYKIRRQLQEAGVGAVVWADWWGSKLELLDAVPAGAAMLHAAGVRVALHSDSPLDVQRLNQQAAAALGAGRRAGLALGRDDAIRWITANPAWVLGIDGEVGTLEPGKRADLVVWSSDPLSVYARAERVYNGGRLVHSREEGGAFPRSDFELGTGSAP